MKRSLFDDDHDAFRSTVHSFYADQVVPEYPEWERAGAPPRHFWTAAGKLGLLGIQVPEEFGGGGQQSFLFNVILTEESQRAGIALGGLRVHTDIAMPYFLRLGDREQQSRWLPRLVSGDAVAALAISEAGAGSDVKALTTRAVRNSDRYVVNGSKTFISNGANADLIVTAVKTDPDAGRQGLSLLVIEGDSPGLTRGRKLEKLGLKAQDLAELSFDDVIVPAENLLGQEGKGFEYLTQNLAQERLSIAVNSQAAAVKALQDTIEYTQSRKAFGTTVSSFQNTKFELAACATEIEAGQSLLDRALVAHESGELSAADAAMVKLFCTELQGRVIDRCLQLYGGYGYMLEYPIARAYADARVSRIYAGSSEVMKVIIAKSLGI
ncbi:acyl-CoA dehydrogenase family protein [Mycobacterium avium]|uniref:acyl-CoA dehydrogenase family protein n=1 Tax=Mycobacterium avium TaxID=1764 RepID=UPI001CC6A2B1|nr:acyl-CoA dehydrogenase family protein [Mycobacterium avium]MBZ4521765.1 acyl-CoA dehydrogenase [Mycobacterium avium subsp. hominissuis]MBZ4531223.1 acyl-CoA dehydrogenase [Mycobacterium avium subsp. hominissuis]